mgnify:CR=1 FL=1
MKKLLLFTTLLLITSTCFSQKEALTWFFGNKIRLNFHAGGEFPQQFFPSSMIARNGSFCLSDKVSGQPIFYSNGEYVWSEGHVPMPNGSEIYGTALNQQPGIAFEVPGTTNKYYIFTNGNLDHPGCYYSVIDMSLNAGLGDVIPDQKNIRLAGIDAAQGVIMATRHPDHKSYWVVFRSIREPNNLYAYFVDEDGVSTEPVISECLTSHGYNEYSMSKFSPDGNFYCYTSSNWNMEEERTYELYSFNDMTGQFSGLFLFKGLPDKPEEYDLEHRSNGIEFSADSKFLYSAIQAVEPGEPPTPKQYIVQFDMNRTGGFEQFEASEKLIHQKDILDSYCQMQLARDGRIYIAHDENKGNKKLSRIYYPHKLNTDCDFRDDEINISGSSESTFGLPLFVPSYFNRFDWLGNCFPDSTYFKSNFHPAPYAISWDFGDGSPTSSQFNPAHKFPSPGTYTVTATAQYPREEVEVVSRTVTIVAYPQFNLGPDFSVCPGTDTTLDVGLVIGAELLWNTGETVPAIVASAGEYWLTAENRYGCVFSDTLSITEYSAPLIDNSNVEIFPATCTGPTGFITGIEIQGAEPFTYIWSDASGNVVGNTLDMPAIGPGTYNLNVIDANGCPWSVPPSHTVISVGTDFVDDVEPSPTYCSFPTGTIRITPDPMFSGDLEYQINGGSWVPDSLFTDLPGGSYTVKIRVKANPSCINDWGTVIVQDFPAPILTSVDPTPELDNNSDGTLTVNVPGTNFYYVIIDSAGVKHEQFNNPLFIDLPSGTYLCYAYDINNCASDTLITIVPQIYSTLLTGDLDGAQPVCLGEHTFVDVKVHNFEGIVEFTATLDYDKSKIRCLPDYLNLHPSLGAVNMDLNTATGRVILTWNSSVPLTLIDTIVLLRLEFATLNPGTAAVTWDLALTEFIEGPGYHLLVSGVTPTQVVIYSNPSLSLSSNPGTCNGTPITISPNVSPPGSYTYLWLKPNGFTTSDQEIYLSNPDSNDQGVYELIITDVNSCRDSASTSLSVYDLPGYAFSDSLLYFDFPDTLFAQSGYPSYLWNTGESTSSIIISDSGYYSVVVTDINGCVSESEVFANGKALKPFFYDLPNAFTPNNDGLNDVFRPATDYELITRFVLNIYNKWGQLVFSTNDPLKGWDGTVNGYDALIGPYAWTIIYSNYNTFNVSSKGIVWLIR